MGGRGAGTVPKDRHRKGKGGLAVPDERGGNPREHLRHLRNWQTRLGGVVVVVQSEAQELAGTGHDGSMVDGAGDGGGGRRGGGHPVAPVGVAGEQRANVGAEARVGRGEVEVPAVTAQAEHGLASHDQGSETHGFSGLDSLLPNVDILGK